MKTSKYITTTSFNNPNKPGEKIVLEIHEVEGGIIGVSPDYADEVANYIANPYHECQMIKLVDPMGNDEEPDPPLQEDELYGFLRIISSLDDFICAHNRSLDNDDYCSSVNSIAIGSMIEKIKDKSGLSWDMFGVLLGLAKNALEEMRK